MQHSQKEPLLEEPVPPPPPPQSVPCCGIFSAKYFAQFFNCTTAEVAWRLFYSLTVVFWRKFRLIGPGKIDMYGPVWIYATMVLSLAVSQNIYSYLTRPAHTKFVYTISYVPTAFAIVYVFGFLVPVLFNIIIRAFGGMISYAQIITIYGYSQAINIIVMLICGYPNSTYQNFCITYGALHSSIFLFLCLKDELQSSEKNLVYIAIGSLAVMQLILVIVYKQYFFGNIYNINNQYYSAQ